MIRIAIPAVAMMLAAQLSSQSVLPSSAANTNPAYWNSYFLYGTKSTTTKNESRTQVLYAESELGSTVKIFKSMQVRRPWSLGNNNVALSGTMSLDLSSSKVSPTAATTNFAANHGTTTNVVSGTISLPARNRGASWPDPWETAIPFKNSSTWIFVPVTGGSLVVENAFSGNSAGQTWYVEGTRPQAGARTTNLNACAAHSDGGRNNSISHRNPVVGGSFLVYYNNMPSNVPSLTASFMILGIGGVGTQQWGLTLPIPLTTLRLPSNNCSLAVTDDLRFPLTYVPSTAGPSRGSLRSPTFPVPNNQALAGLSFYDQGVCTDTNATTKAPEIYMSWSSKWTIGSGVGDPIATVFRIGDNTQTTGSSVLTSQGPTLLFN